MNNYKIFELIENWEWDEAKELINEIINILIKIAKTEGDESYLAELPFEDFNKTLEKATGLKIEDILKNEN